jgi:uncharacterized protein (TIGR02001 family)
MQKTKLLVALLATLSAAPVLAADAAPASPHTFTSNVGVVSDYLYRGISQTGAQPAIQGGFDYAHSSGFYAGVWGSSISWVSDVPAVATSAPLELDTYLGFKGTAAADVTYDVGFLRYNYPGTYAAGATKADTDELYGQIGYKWVTAKYSYSTGKTFGVPDASGTDYLDLSASYPIEGTGVTVGAHLGKQTYRGNSVAFKAATAATPNYTDYKLSVTKDFSGYVLGLAYSKTNAPTGAGTFYHPVSKDLGKGTVVVSLNRSF